MQSKKSDRPTIKSPFRSPISIGPLTTLTKEKSRDRDAVFIEEISVKPNDQRRIPLGSFTKERPPKGFLVGLDPDHTPDEAIVTQVTSLGMAERYTLFMDIANFGKEIVHAAVWRL